MLSQSEVNDLNLPPSEGNVHTSLETDVLNAPNVLPSPATDASADVNAKALSDAMGSAEAQSISQELGSVAATPPAQSIGEGENMDGRRVGEWQSRYPPEAIKEIVFDAWFVGILLLAILVSLLLTWNGMLFRTASWICDNQCSAKSFSKFSLFFLGGLLGGTLFGIKYLYKAVGRGNWNVDRRLWRIFSPLVSGGLALAVGAMIDSGIVGLTANAHSSSAYLSMGFITGYFADGALAKMQDVADTIFGSGRRSPPASSVEKK